MTLSGGVEKRGRRIGRKAGTFEEAAAAATVVVGADRGLGRVEIRNPIPGEPEGGQQADIGV